MLTTLDGRMVSEKIAAELSLEIKRLKIEPGLAIIQVGDLATSSLYIKRKIAFANKIGVRVDHLRFSEDSYQDELLSEIDKLNHNNDVGGIIVQLPLPNKLDKSKIVEEIAPEKDVDGLRVGSIFTPATARGILSLLDHYQIKISGKRVVVVGRSTLVGKPIARALLSRGATVTICHRQTQNLADETRRADILVVAAGSPHLIKENYVKPGQVVIDVGLSSTGEGKLLGDVDQVSVREIVSAISPVPGGVGPMTVVSLFLNLLDAYKSK
ncbi:bifunctional 5,10-methylenetetrahydrofolate dehydrogenase/5,10-methenyltetrahydrofolate cyclohydrolase [Candidatus Nomurabacteria bacterium]|nr:bifunctional 5,10-methylenetetrahydrofolate dehydrogenase/5,10-methenyltetrahydrofolate cyclohydrolase [Candidatus Nomurabacteria bacterium]